MFGHRPDELIGRAVEALVPGELRNVHEKQRETFHQCPSRRQMGSGLDLRGLHKSGRQFPVDISLSSVETSDGRLAVAAIRDISDKVRTIEELRFSQRCFEIAANCAADLIWEATLKDGDLHDNAPLKCFGGVNSILGYSPGEYPHTVGAFLKLVHPDDLDALSETIQRALKSGHDFQAKCRVRRNDGAYLDWEIRAKPVASQDGKPVAWIGVTSDVTARRKAERSLRESLVELRTLKERLQIENIYLKEEAESRNRQDAIVGDSEALRAVLEQVKLVAPTGANVLLLGETGTGKGLIAREIHQRSCRKDRQFVTVDCAALPATLIESELFGHEKGAYTGATRRKLGHLELADGGTLFLDEIGELPRELQSKLLRAVQDGEFQRLGASTTRRVDVRVIAATNRDLSLAVQNGDFRSDLYYRLAVFPITLPPLRERRADIKSLTWFFVDRTRTSIRRRIEHVPDDALDALVAYDWPGNVRELQNVIERAVILSPTDTLELDPSFAPRPGSKAQKPHALQQDLAAVQRNHILSVLQECDWKIKGAGNTADRLGLKVSTLRSRMKKLQLTRPQAM
jgi:PAS domain S-box-containing protein